MRKRTPIENLTVETRRSHGRDWHVFSDGNGIEHVLPVIRGGDGEDDPPDPNAGENSGGEGGESKGGEGGEKSTPKSYTQDEIDRMVQERLRKDRDARQKQLDEKLGGRKLDEVLAAATEHQAAVDAQKSEAEKQLEEANKKIADADVATRKAAAAELRADAVTALVVGGVNPERVQRATEMLLGDLTKLDSIEDDSIKTTVEALQKEFPELFSTSSTGDANGRKPAGSIGGRVPAGGSGEAKTGVDAGRERARKERGENGDGKSTELFEGLKPLGSLS